MTVCIAEKAVSADFLATKRTAWLLLVVLLLGLSACQSVPRKPFHVQGIVWQPHQGAPDPRGNWHKLGAEQLLVQWSVVDGIAYVPVEEGRQSETGPDWRRIAREPWAQSIVLGLAGRFDTHLARTQGAELSRQSLGIATSLSGQSGAIKVSAWYFPIEVDPSWAGATQMREWLAPLPRPLWVSVFDHQHLGPAAFSAFVSTWLPTDVGVFFQDGVGLHVREAAVAREYLDALRNRFGPERVKVIAEVFRPNPGGGFRSATAEEIRSQLPVYDSYPIFLFDGPTYLPGSLVEELLTPAVR